MAEQVSTLTLDLEVSGSTPEMAISPRNMAIYVRISVDALSSMQLHYVTSIITS